MPLSYTLLTSGVFAIFTTSTNLVAQGQESQPTATTHPNGVGALQLLFCASVSQSFALSTLTSRVSSLK
eukprot:6196634-Amphidinium_carterae.2